MREINHLSIHEWLRFAIPDSQQQTSPIGFLFLKLPPPPCAVLLVVGQSFTLELSKFIRDTRLRTNSRRKKRKGGTGEHENKAMKEDRS